MLTTAKLDAASYHWVASLANYNFQLYYWARKTNIDADTLLRVSWPGCMPDSSGTHLKVTAAAVQAVQETSLEGLASPIDAYSCNLHVLDAVQHSQQVTCMTLEDWHQAQQVDPTLSLVISRLWNGSPEWQWSKSTYPPEFSLFLWEQNHLVLKQGILYRWTRPRESEETLFQMVLPSTQREVVLKGCHDQVGHLGRSWTMHEPWRCSFGLTWLLRQRNTSESATHSLPLKPGRPKLPLKILWPHIPWSLSTSITHVLNQGKV